MQDRACSWFVGIASLCQREERRADGSLTLIGVVDRLEIPSPEDTYAASLPRRLVVRFYNPEPSGPHTVQVYCSGSDCHTRGFGRRVSFDATITTLAFDLGYKIADGDHLNVEVWVDQHLASHVRLPIDRAIGAEPDP